MIAFYLTVFLWVSRIAFRAWTFLRGMISLLRVLFCSFAWFLGFNLGFFAFLMGFHHCFLFTFVRFADSGSLFFGGSFSRGFGWSYLWAFWLWALVPWCVGLDVPLFCYIDPLFCIDRYYDVYSIVCIILNDSQTNKQTNIPLPFLGGPKLDLFSVFLGFVAFGGSFWGRVCEESALVLVPVLWRDIDLKVRAWTCPLYYIDPFPHIDRCHDVCSVAHIIVIDSHTNIRLY